MKSKTILKLFCIFSLNGSKSFIMIVTRVGGRRYSAVIKKYTVYFYILLLVISNYIVKLLHEQYSLNQYATATNSHNSTPILNLSHKIHNHGIIHPRKEDGNLRCRSISRLNCATLLISMITLGVEGNA